MALTITSPFDLGSANPDPSGDIIPVAGSTVTINNNAFVDIDEATEVRSTQKVLAPEYSPVASNVPCEIKPKAAGVVYAETGLNLKRPYLLSMDAVYADQLPNSERRLLSFKNRIRWDDRSFLVMGPEMRTVSAGGGGKSEVMLDETEF